MGYHSVTEKKRIQPLVHKILCTQETVTPMQMPEQMGSAPKSICPPSLRWGNITLSIINSVSINVLHGIIRKIYILKALLSDSLC